MAKSPSDPSRQPTNHPTRPSTSPDVTIEASRRGFMAGRSQNNEEEVVFSLVTTSHVRNTTMAESSSDQSRQPTNHPLIPSTSPDVTIEASRRGFMAGRSQNKAAEATRPHACPSPHGHLGFDGSGVGLRGTFSHKTVRIINKPNKSMIPTVSK
jgi:hypothetical protein